VTPHQIRPAQAIPIRLGGDEPGIHLTQDWQSTLCGKRIPAGTTWPDHYRRDDCSECWKLAEGRGLKVERQT